VQPSHLEAVAQELGKTLQYSPQLLETQNFRTLTIAIWIRLLRAGEIVATFNNTYVDASQQRVVLVPITSLPVPFAEQVLN